MASTDIKGPSYYSIKELTHFLNIDRETKASTNANTPLARPWGLTGSCYDVSQAKVHVEAARNCTGVPAGFVPSTFGSELGG